MGFATARRTHRAHCRQLARTAIFAALVISSCLFGVATAIAQVQQLQEPMRLRITWGGGAASEWSGASVSTTARSAN